MSFKPKILFLFYFCCITKNLAVSSECIIEGCLCEYDTALKNYDIECEADGDVDETTPFFPARLNLNDSSKYLNVNEFRIEYFYFTEIPDDVFENFSINKLLFVENEVNKISKYDFRGIKSLSSLTLIEINLEIIEKDCFSWFNNTLLELDLTRSNLSDSTFELIANEFIYTKNLRSLNLKTNRISYLKAGWFSQITKLQDLNLYDNAIRTIDQNVFSSVLSLANLNMGKNGIKNITQILSVLSPIRNSLKMLGLSFNSIELLDDFSFLEKLASLDLATNLVKTINKTTLDHLKLLESFNLESNQLNKIDDDSFETLINLKSLNLRNNYLSKLPNLSYLINLTSLDFNNQNGRLNSLNNYVFDVAAVLAANGQIKNLEVNLNLNNITKLDNKTFCSNYLMASRVKSIIVSYSSFQKMDKCVIKQLGTLDAKIGPTIVEVSFLNEVITPNDFCNSSCALIGFLEKYNVLLDPCYEMNICSNSSKLGFNDDCSNKTEFKCSYLGGGNSNRADSIYRHGILNLALIIAFILMLN